MNYYIVRSDHGQEYHVSIPGSKEALIPLNTEVTIDGRPYTVIYAYHDEKGKKNG